MNIRALQNARESLHALLSLIDETTQMVIRRGEEVTCPGSQDGEDDFALQALGDEPGTYVDIGAYWPIETSNTWRFYQKGWRGLLIEPNPGAVCALSIGRPGDQIRAVASGNYHGSALLAVHASSSHLVAREDMEGRKPMLVVPVEPLSYTLSLYPDIRDRCRFCSIDTEGTERQVLEGIDWKTFQPEILCIEHRTEYPGFFQEDSSADWTKLLHANDYVQVWKTQFNTLFRLGRGT